MKTSFSANLRPPYEIRPKIFCIFVENAAKNSLYRIKQMLYDKPCKLIAT